MDHPHYDFVIVGGGSAGCALAHRLSADPSRRVLVLEAGRPDAWWDVFIHMPAALAFPLGSRFYDWRYRTEPEPYMAGREIYHARGKLLGGSSSINGMVFVRGQAQDFDTWAQLGNRGWSYRDVLPFFKSMESYTGGDDEFRGRDGPLKVSDLDETGPLYDSLMAAAGEVGIDRNPDYNGARQDGISMTQATIRNGRRMSTAYCYLGPARARSNLEIQTGALTR